MHSIAQLSASLGVLVAFLIGGIAIAILTLGDRVGIPAIAAGRRYRTIQAVSALAIACAIVVSMLPTVVFGNAPDRFDQLYGLAGEPIHGACNVLAVGLAVGAVAIMFKRRAERRRHGSSIPPQR